MSSILAESPNHHDELVTPKQTLKISYLMFRLLFTVCRSVSAFQELVYNNVGANDQLFKAYFQTNDDKTLDDFRRKIRILFEIHHSPNNTNFCTFDPRVLAVLFWVMANTAIAFKNQIKQAFDTVKNAKDQNIKTQNLITYLEQFPFSSQIPYAIFNVDGDLVLMF